MNNSVYVYVGYYKNTKGYTIVKIGQTTQQPINRQRVINAQKGIDTFKIIKAIEVQTSKELCNIASIDKVIGLTIEANTRLELVKQGYALQGNDHFVIDKQGSNIRRAQQFADEALTIAIEQCGKLNCTAFQHCYK